MPNIDQRQSCSKYNFILSFMFPEMLEEEQTCPFQEETHLTDVALVVEGKKLFVSKVILAVSSPVFNAMFYSNFKEKDANEVLLSDKKYDDVVTFLKCIYPDYVQTITSKYFNSIQISLPYFALLSNR